MPASDHILLAIEHVLPSIRPRLKREEGSWAELALGQTTVRARWIPRGLPSEVRAALEARPSADVIVAPTMSYAARALTKEHCSGWLDEQGGGDFAVNSVVVVRPSEPIRPTSKRWTAATCGVVEALLVNTPATVSVISEVTTLSVGAATKALALLTDQGLLYADSKRGRSAGRRVLNQEVLLETYFENLAKQNSGSEIRVGVVWRDPLKEAGKLGKRFAADGRAWAATSALGAAAYAPHLTQIAPLEMFVESQSYAELAVAAARVGLEPIEGGGLVLRNFPSRATAALSNIAKGTRLSCAPWPRVYADLRLRGGVRGDDAADHLREKMLAETKSQNGV